MGVLSSVQDLWYLLELEPERTSPLLPAAFFAKMLPEYKEKIKFSKENRTFITRSQQGKCWVEEQKFPKPPANKKNIYVSRRYFVPAVPGLLRRDAHCANLSVRTPVQLLYHHHNYLTLRRTDLEWECKNRIIFFLSAQHFPSHSFREAEKQVTVTCRGWK